MAARTIEVRFGGNMRDTMEGILVPVYKHEPGENYPAFKLFIHDFGPGKGMSIDLIVPTMFKVKMKAWEEGKPVMDQAIPNHFTLHSALREEEKEVESDTVDEAV
jgi:hypothetical protein